ncbi:hypothetical protein B9Z65_601 [Elsinoe australis]|uniref:Peptidase S33 tripeptidyl aminopeptidase-like C-terminal domain-containing protein n=1 Tax=Elsinoe australis TaxID=40998 RepID=A0A2P8AJ20_9PEZI|nr:hypothetical protein B9Z65_601 [Elsinoe australis]
MTLTSSLLLLSVLAFSQASPTGHKKPIEHKSPTQQLQWGPCGDILTEILPANTTAPPVFDCATLPVPLDYTDEHSPLLNLSLVRVKATQEPVLGSVLTNPGGPGGSGVENIVLGYPLYQEVLGGQFNLIGWDPRGTGKTIPFLCDIPPANATEFVPEAQQNLTNTLLADGWTTAEAYAEVCYDAQRDTGSFLSTAFVARDMIEISDALCEPDVKYFGTSYGTQLGSTFAAMFPDRVGRVLLDAVVNPKDYVAGPKFTWLADTEKVYNSFFSECASFPDNCALLPLLNGTNTTSDPAVLGPALRAAVDAQVLALLDPALNLGSAGPQLYRTYKEALRGAMYSPSLWPTYARALADVLIRGNTTALDEATPAPSRYNPSTDNFFGISCGDTPWRADVAEDLIPIAERQQEVSYFSDTFYDTATWRCAAWKFEAAELYEGDFVAKTKNPVLLVGGTHDPITPLMSAFNASAGFEGSVMLTNDGFGHSFLNEPSQCVYEAVRKYFITGELPAKGTVCKADRRPFDAAAGGDNTTVAVGNTKRSVEEDALRKAREAMDRMRIREHAPFGI